MSIQLSLTEQPFARPHSHSPSSIISNPSRNPTPSSSIISPIPSATSSIGFPSSISPYSTSPFAIDANGMNLVEPDTPSDLDSPSAQATNQPSDVDPQILEALRNKDRIYVLKLGELMEGLIKERRPRIDLTPATSYQRLLVHRCSAYYKLAPETDPTTKGISVLPTIESRIPFRRICELVPAEATAQPAFKIMLRSPPDRRPKLPRSQTGSVAGEDADLSDVEPSESGSLGGRSSATGGSTKKRMTIEEREAAYNEARSRIFMGFEEKEKAKDKDMSSSSSSLSLLSGSASIGGDGSSVGDLDDSASSPATESEWSGPSGPPLTRDKREGRRGGSGNASASSSTRSLRSNAPSFNANGTGSSRNSRAPSPSFTYPSLYEPPSSAQMYDPSQLPGPPNPGYHAAQYIYPYSAPNQPLNQPYHYPYYAPQYNTYQHPPHHPSRDSSDSSIPETYPPLQTMNFGNPYIWTPPNQPPLQSPPHMQQHPPLPPHQSQPPQHSMASHPPHSPHYQPYLTPSQPYPYPIPGYYPPPPGQHMPPPPPPHMGMQQSMYELPRVMNGNMVGNDPNHGNLGSGGGRPNLSNGVVSSNSNGRSTTRNGGIVHGGNGNSKQRNGPPILPSTRSSWSYGPGVGIGGHVPQSGTNGGEAVGPRFSNTRRQSGNSSSSNSRASSYCDDVSSTASSSTTSSSSRRTYTSTTSSQHPLPARPDWAVGIKAQPSLARHHDHTLTNSHSMSPISPSRPLNGNSAHLNNVPPHQPLNQEQTPIVPLQPTDFPPLTPAAEKRNPVVNGAWGNSSSTRSILSPSTGHQPVFGNALVNHSPNSRLEEPARGLERPPPKSSELFNPKIVRRTATGPTNTNGKTQGDRERETARGDAVANAILVAQIEKISLEEKGSEHSLVVSTS
ncbi:hypothetical protein K443DRAFT_671944 [Laccaria amethystina LaAM-08-1]|uniref:SUZ domain-containing protein n=1 Tax=Laccaria amethystina LaAM-08-1 TaxID=1095629 RepID=A0A0C9YLG0_9AGAR|nr:hypothetical protein K443DRAFT_671944 [Laccaria amethystina LaAM-08-1]